MNAHHNQARSTRRTLQPRKPQSRKRSDAKPVGQRKTQITYNRRDYRLTDEQQAWARSLTVSLSGCAARRKFLADLQAQRDAEIRHGESPDPMPSQVSLSRPARAPEDSAVRARNAAAWARKAQLMHEAGGGKERVIGWDCVQERYVREDASDVEIAAEKAGTRTRTRKGTKCSAGERSSRHDSATTDHGSEGSHHDDGPRITITIPDPVPPSPPPPSLDWRAKARLGVARKKLSLAREWSALTWTQKSSVHERLLLLEQDGLDVSELLGTKAGSNKVTALLLRRQGRGAKAAMAMPHPPPSPPSSPSPLPPSSPLPLFPLRSSRPSPLRVVDVVDATAGAEGEDVGEHDALGDGAMQGFDPVEAYVPQRSARLKRKRGGGGELRGVVKRRKIAGETRLEGGVQQQGERGEYITVLSAAGQKHQSPPYPK
ncbi:hypothetical protein SVAN01_03981 [Stagonosporopsis vannaccii]|nr:hypothetical protein SVAN01_03981 [Stagonosporopsis vannaccii]